MRTVEVNGTASLEKTEASTADLKLNSGRSFPADSIGVSAMNTFTGLLGIWTGHDIDNTAVGVWTPNAGVGPL